jgi:predicted DNA-binding protein (UPF0251 family)
MATGSYNVNTANSYNYERTTSVKKALRNFLRLEEKAVTHGNYDALAILSDLKTGLGMYKSGPALLTKRQLECVQLCLIEDLTEAEAAYELGVSQQAVHYGLKAGIRRIQKYLLSGRIEAPVFSSVEEKQLIILYTSGHKPMEISNLLQKSPNTIRNKIKYLKKKGLIGG